MFTILCCYNNREELEQMLLPSLQRQTVPYNLLLIDSRAKGYRSAAEAYNRTLEAHRTQNGDETGNLLFTHQDVSFDDADFLLKLEQAIDHLQGSIVGLAGITLDGQIFSNLRYRATGQFITRQQTDRPIEAASLDECLFAMPWKVWQQTRFDEQTCYHWHLYAVDLCYAARLEQQTRSYILPLPAYHKQTAGNGLYTDDHFLRTMWRMIRKYRKHVPMLYTICYRTSTRYLPAALHMLLVKQYTNKQLRKRKGN